MELNVLYMVIMMFVMPVYDSLADRHHTLSAVWDHYCTMAGGTMNRVRGKMTLNSWGTYDAECLPDGWEGRAPGEHGNHK